MLQLTKVFHFEMAHAICGYPGACRNIHGHSYELHVSVSSTGKADTFLPSPGFEIDFKEIKKLVNESIVRSLDHKLVLSDAYLEKHPMLVSPENLVTFAAEPTAENLLIYIVNTLQNVLPENIILSKLTLYETKDSYAEWSCSTGQKSNRALIKVIPGEKTENDLTLTTGNS